MTYPIPVIHSACHFYIHHFAGTYVHGVVQPYIHALCFITLCTVHTVLADTVHDA